MAKKKTGTLDFERSLSELEQLVERMEQGEQPLEEALRQFEQGIELARSCHLALTAAEQRVEQLIERDGALATAPFGGDSDSESDDSGDDSDADRRGSAAHG